MSPPAPSSGPLAAFFGGRIRSLHDQARRAVAPNLISSPWLRGYFRELLLRDLLQPLIPHTCRLVTGTVVDSWRRRGPRKRPQDDILLVDGECLPPLFEVTDNGMYPVESVLARFEVKTTIRDKDEVGSILRAAEEFWRLKPIMMKRQGAAPSAEPDLDPRPLQVLFAFNKVKQRWLAQLRAGLDHLMKRSPGARFFFCVPGQLLWAYTRPYPDVGTDWYCCDLAESQEEEFPEVLSFIALLLQELPALREMRRREARLSRYVRCLSDHRLVVRTP